VTAASRQPPVVSRILLLALLLFFSVCAPVAAQLDCATPRAVAPDAATGRFVLLSWNVHGIPNQETIDTRIDNIAREILRRRPDLVLLQEAWMTDAAARFDCRLRGEYEVVPDGEGVRTGPLSLFGHRRGGLLALVRRDSPWKLDAKTAPRFAEFETSGPLSRVGSERDAIAGKGIQAFVIGDGSIRLAVLNTHLQSQYAPRDYADIRLSQIRQLLGEVEKTGGDATLVAGDFNTSPVESALYGELTRALNDLTAEYHRACNCGTLTGVRRRTRHWFDYVLARTAGAVKLEAKTDLIRNTGLLEPYSDHHGVWVEMRLTK